MRSWRAGFSHRTAGTSTQKEPHREFTRATDNTYDDLANFFAGPSHWLLDPNSVRIVEHPRATPKAVVRIDGNYAHPWDSLGALYWAASHLGLPTLADGGYNGAGHGVHTPIKQPSGGQTLAPGNQALNTLHRATRCRGERGFALLTGRWRALRRITASPRRIGHYVKAALVLLHIEQLLLRAQLRSPC